MFMEKEHPRQGEHRQLMMLRIKEQGAQAYIPFSIWLTQEEGGNVEEATRLSEIEKERRKYNLLSPYGKAWEDSLKSERGMSFDCGDEKGANRFRSLLHKERRERREDLAYDGRWESLTISVEGQVVKIKKVITPIATPL